MCGRYSLKTPADVYEAVFRLALHYELRRRYNIAPTQDAPIVLIENNDDSRASVMMRWGLIPSWAKDEKIGNRMINARIETAREKPSFRSAYKHRRCLVPADGFYEWQAVDDGKQPYYMHRADEKPFAFAGLWETWSSEAGDIQSYTILTCEAGRKLKRLHDRMPVIVPEEAFDDWLGGEMTEPDALTKHAHRMADSLSIHAVSRKVNTPRHDAPDCILPIEG